VTHVRDYKIDGWSRLIIQVVSPKGAPLPIAESGFHIHDTDEENIAASGGAVPFLISLLDNNALSHRYASALTKWRQGNLFS
jgi:hypothetical protein